MKRWNVALYIILVTLLTGCGPVDSINPLFSDKDVIFDSALEGGWMAEDGGLRIARADSHSSQYRILTLNESGKCDAKADAYAAYLVNLDGHRFLDVVQDIHPDSSMTNEFHIIHAPSKGGAKDEYKVEPALSYLGNSMYADASPAHSDGSGASFSLRVRQAHWFLSVHLENEKLHLAMLDEDWVNKGLQKGSLTIPHALLGSEHKQLVLTATTEELQRFVRDHEDDKEAFPPMTEMHRIE